jgi:tetratricopeptide (TPR) repeat protein
MHFLRTTVFYALVTLISLLTGVAIGADLPGNNYFSSGIQAFAEGKYEKALELFQAANKVGLNSSELHYNLGVTYYRLKRYPEAGKEFERLSKVPETEPLAHYNLGLIALATGKKADAKNHFKITSRTATDEKLRTLADDQLRELVTGKKGSWLSGYISLAPGYDDNVYLIADDEVIVGNVKDYFMEYTGAATLQLSGTRENGLQLKGTAYYQDYLDANEFDFGNLHIGPEFDRKLGRWNTSLAGFVDRSYIDKDLFEQIYTAELRGSREIYRNLDLRLRYQFSYIDAESPYQDLSGNRHRMTAGLRSILWGTDTRLDYTFELNDRDDPDFPTRHTMALLADRDLSDVWSVGVNASYRYSDYQSSDREDKRIWLGARISRSIPWGFRAFGKYDHIRNISSLDESDFSSNVFSIGLERFF